MGRKLHTLIDGLRREYGEEIIAALDVALVVAALIVFTLLAAEVVQ
jgi:hypothetical protein